MTTTIATQDFTVVQSPAVAGLPVRYTASLERLIDEAWFAASETRSDDWETMAGFIRDAVRDSDELFEECLGIELAADNAYQTIEGWLALQTVVEMVLPLRVSTAGRLRFIRAGTAR